jgi:hypothetical protein
MTATREAITLPLMFLTVAGLGGLRVGHTVALIPPPLVSLVLALMLVGALVRAGVFAPHSLLNAGRSSLENLSGLTVLIALVAASAQVFTLVTPERGLLHAIFSICFFVQLATTLAGVNGRRNLLRSLVVLLGAAFVIRFIVLEALYAADGGLAKRLLTTLLEGASLGSLQYEPVGATTGYIAFFVLVLYFIAIILLPPAEPPDALTVLPIEESPSILPVVLVVLAVACSGCRDWTSTDTRAEEGVAADAATVARVREDALATARVWSPPAVPVAQFDFAANPPHGFERSDEVSCRFTVRKLSGATPKFHCALPDGRILKIKYGRRNAELEAEGGRSCRHPPPACPRVQRRRHVHGSSRALRRVPSSSVPVIEMRRSRRQRIPLLCRTARLQLGPHLPVGSDRAAAGRRDRRGIRRSGMGLVRARSHRCGARRCNPSRSGRLEADGGVPVALG